MIRRRTHHAPPPITTTTAANGATAPMSASSQSTVSRNARQPPVSPLASPGGGTGLCLALALTAALGPTRVSVTVAKAVSWLSACCCASIDSRPEVSVLIWSWTTSRALTLPASLSSARSWLMAASSDVTWLPTSATCWVTSCACCRRESWVPSPVPVSLASVAG